MPLYEMWNGRPQGVYVVGLDLMSVVLCLNSWL